MSGYADWNPSVVYNALDIVDYNAKIWVSQQSLNINHAPDVSPTWWSQAGGGSTAINAVIGQNGISASVAGSTATIEQTNVGTAGSYAYPQTITTDATGRITSATAGSQPVQSLNSQVGAVSLQSAGSTIVFSNPSPGVVNLEGMVGVSSVNSQTGAVSLTSSGSTITFSNPAPGVIDMAAVGGGGGTLTGITAGPGIAVSGGAPSPQVALGLTNFIFTDSLPNISPVGGITQSPNIFTVPRTGVYLFNFSITFSTTPTGIAPYTQVSMNPVAREFVQVRTESPTAPFFVGSNYISYLTTLPASNYYTQTFDNTDSLVLTAGKQIFLSVQVQNSGTVSWGDCSAFLNIVALC